MTRVSSMLIIIVYLISLSLNGQNTETIQKSLVDISKYLKYNDPESTKDKVILPGVNNQIFEFNIVKMNLISDDLLESNPDLRKYKAYYLKDLSGTFRGFLVMYENQMSAGFETGSTTVRIEPDFDRSENTHYIWEEAGTINKISCNPDEIRDILPDWRIKIRSSKSSRNTLSNGTVKRTYRMAIICTGEFYQANGNNNAAVTMRINSSVAGINFIYNRDLATEFTISNISLRNNPNTDEFIPDETGGDPRTTQAGRAIAMAFPNVDSYDIGHVLHTHASGDGWSSGGVARLSSTCRNFVFDGSPLKAQGWSGAFSNVGFSWISLFAHEVAHMMGANHTFNGTGESCTEAISETTAYEIGSGTTIMSYQGICSQEQNIPGSSELNNYFHVASLQEMLEYIQAGATCATTTPINNPIPEVTTNPCNAPLITIPRNTPFYLQGSASDANSTGLTYTWEQFNEDGPGTPTQGLIGVPASNSTTAPLFRSFPPSSINERYFPDMTTIASGILNPFNVLSNRERVLKFRLTVRDNHSAGGAIAVDDIDVAVSPQGPLSVTSPANNQTIVAGTPLSVTWETNNTDNLCNQVEIRLSTDGGINYNIVLATGVDYSLGNFSFNVPINFPAFTQGKIMVSCSDYDCIKFFAVSNGNFRITSSCIADPSFICPTTTVSGSQGDPVFNLNSMSQIRGTIITSQEMNITGSSPIGQISTFNVDQSGCINVVNNRFESILISTTESGTYEFSIDVGNAGGFGFVSLFRAAGFNPANPCPQFISSSGRNVMETFVSASSTMQADLEACTVYLLAFYNYGADGTRRTLVSNIRGPGNIIRINQNPNPDYSTIYLAVQENNGIIRAVNTNGDFTYLPGGRYIVYGATYKSAGVSPPSIANPNSWIGFNVQEIIGTECARLSGNSRLLEIEGTCKLENVEPGERLACNPADNSFIQQIIVTHENAAGAILKIGNQEFTLSGSSPETLNYTDQSNGGTVGVQVFIVGEEACTFNIQIERPENCCPFDILVQDIVAICEGETAQISAGNGADIYQWFDSANNLIGEGSVISLNIAGNYRVTASSTTGCSRSKNFALVIENNPTLSVPFNSLELCTGTSRLVEITTNAATIRWFRNGIEIPGANFPFLLINNDGNYTVRVGSSEICQLEESISVVLLPSPTVSLGAPVVNICDSESVTLTAETQNVEFRWFVNNMELAGENGPSITVNTSGTYRLEVTNSLGCSASALVAVNVFTSPVVDIEEDTEFCEGTTVVISANTDAPAFVWRRNGIPVGSGNLSLEISQPGTYVFEAFGAGGCSTRDSLTVTQLPAPVFDLGEDRLACIGNELELVGPAGDFTYEWYSGSVLLGQDQNLIVTTPDLYSLIVTSNSNGCSFQDFVVVLFVPGPTLTINNSNVNICQGESFEIVASTNATSIVWLRNGIEIVGATDFRLLVSQSGTYTARVSGNEGCVVERNAVVTVNPLPVFELGNDINACEGDMVTLSVGVSGSYQWFLNGNPLSTNQQIQVLQSGMYRLVVTNANNCSFSDEVSVNFSPAPTLSGPDILNFCEGESVTISVQSNGVNFRWLIDGITIPGQTSRELTVNLPGVYSVIARNTAGCERQLDIIVNRRAKPIVNLGNNAILCPGENIALNAGNPDNQYLWSTGETSQIINVRNENVMTTSTITYTVTVTNSFNCVTSASIQITFRPVISASLTAPKNGVCEGESITLTAAGGLNYIWSGPAGTLNTTNGNIVIATPLVNSTYSVTVSDDCPGNEDSESIDLVIFPPLVNASAGRDTCIVLGRSIRLNATGGSTYSWESDPSFIGSNRVANPEVKPTEATIYTVTITDSNGCTLVDNVEVCIIEDPLSLIIPINAITPNGDGANDDLEFTGLEAFPDNKLTVFNRWGNVIFEKLRYQQDAQRFDGTRGGDILPADTYYYILEFEGNIIKSSLTIIREK